MDSHTECSIFTNTLEISSYLSLIKREWVNLWNRSSILTSCLSSPLLPPSAKCLLKTYIGWTQLLNSLDFSFISLFRNVWNVEKNNFQRWFFSISLNSDIHDNSRETIEIILSVSFFRPFSRLQSNNCTFIKRFIK